MQELILGANAFNHLRELRAHVDHKRRNRIVANARGIGEELEHGCNLVADKYREGKRGSYPRFTGGGMPGKALRVESVFNPSGARCGENLAGEGGFYGE